MELKTINRLLEKCWNLILGALSRTDAEPAPVEGGEVLARYLFQKNMYNASGVVKQSAFLPYPRTETSVFRKSRMSKKDYVGSKAYVSGIKGKSMKAVALIDVQCIAPSLGVSIEPEESDYPWHANIVGWPAKKHEQKSIAQQLAKISTIE